MSNLHTTRPDLIPGVHAQQPMVNMRQATGSEAAIKIHGNSGCSVRLLEVDRTIVIEKAAVEAKYSERLKLQIEKQEMCRASNRLPFIRVPQVLERFEEGQLFHARMEYVYHQTLSSFFPLLRGRA